MAPYTIEHRISHADVDLLGELTVAALLGLLEQTAVEASTAAGLDPGWYTRAGRMWIIRRTHLERFLPVGGGDTIAVATRVADWRRARSLREYEVRLQAAGRGIRPEDKPVRQAGEAGRAGDDRPLVARATTDWVYCDIAAGRPVSIPEDVRRAFAADAPGDAHDRPRPIADQANGASVDMEVVVRPSHLDHVAHVNNANYAHFLEDGAFALFGANGLGSARMLAMGGALRLRSLDLEYLVDALDGDRLTVRSWPVGAIAVGAGSPHAAAEACLLQRIDRADGRALVHARSEWRWRRRSTILGGPPSAD